MARTVYISTPVVEITTNLTNGNVTSTDTFRVTGRLTELQLAAQIARRIKQSRILEASADRNIRIVVRF